MKNSLIENDIKKMTSLIEYSIGHPINEQVEKVSVSWLRNTANLIKKGKTLNDQSLRNQGRKEVILAYFPMADPNWSPTLRDVKSYLNSSVIKQKEIIDNVNKQLQKLDGKELVDDSYSKNMGTLLKIPLGYLNVNYWTDLIKARLLKYTNESFTGNVSVRGGASIPDGIFKGASLNLSANAKFNVGFTGKVVGDNVILTLYPKSINLNTSWVKVNKSLSGLSTMMKLTLGAVYALSYLFEFRISNNQIQMRLEAFDKEWFNTTVGSIDPTSMVKQEMKNVKVTLPISVLKSGSLPNSVGGYQKLAQNVAGGLKVEKG
tara:strand:+ start:436 stop:1389 length:954 start_codon:yes stop_codon:yes gene_type:complete